MENQQLNDIIDMLKRSARGQTSVDQSVTLDDMRGWSTPEVFDAGVDDGAIYQARRILTSVGIDYRK